MRESGYYPPGAEFDPNAPWNEREPKPINVKVWVNANLRREAAVGTTNYTDESDEGGYSIDLHDGFADLERYYNEQHHGILYLLNELVKYINGELAGGGVSGSRRQELQAMLEDCQGWTEDAEIEDYET